MKGFFILLVLSNLLFIGWKFWIEPGSQILAPSAGVSPINEGLTLLSEIDQNNRPPLRNLKAVKAKSTAEKSKDILVATIKPKIEALSVDDNVPTSSMVCYQSSLLTTLNEAQALQQSLAKLGVKGTKRVTLETQKTNYWVMLKAYKSRAKADEAGTILKKRRVKDFFIVRSGRYENAVSLGVYSTRERAELRYKQMIALKAPLRKPVIEAIELPAKRLAVRFNLTNKNNSKAFLDLLNGNKQPHLKKVSCK